MLNEYFIWAAGILSLNLVLAVGAISIFRYLQGVISGVNTTTELAKKDNYAFGISFAGGALALAFIIAAAIGGEPSASILTEGFNVAVYALVGIVLLKIGMLVNDRLIFHRFSLKDQIDQENLSAGIVQGVNFVVLGIVIQSSIKWVETETWDGLIPVTLVFFAAQVLLLIITRLRASIYRRRHTGQRFQEALREGNPALAIRYAGHILSAALGVSASSHLIPYLQDAPWLSALYWFVVSLGVTLLITILAWLARQVILREINIVEEVDNQHNVGVAYIEAAIFVSIAIILNPLMLIFDSIL